MDIYHVLFVTPTTLSHKISGCASLQASHSQVRFAHLIRRGHFLTFGQGIDWLSADLSCDIQLHFSTLQRQSTIKSKLTSLVEFPTRSALSKTFSLDFFRLAASLITMLSFLLPLGPVFTAESSRNVFQHQRVFQCAFVFPEMNSVQDNSQVIIIGPLPEGRFSRMHGIQDDKTPSPSYRLDN